MRVRVWAAGLAAMLVVGIGVAQQRDWSAVEIKTEAVRGNIHMLSTNVGGNIGVSVGPDGILIIDDQFAPLADKIKAALAALNPGKLKFIVNTHWHGDHTGANPVFGPEVPIIAHTNVRERLKAATPPRKAMAKEGWPVITFDQAVSIHFNGEEIKAIHFPKGHTDGDSVIFFTGANVVHMGDDFFSGRFPFVDLDSGGSVEGLTNNIAGLIQKLPADVRIIPGHGPISTLDDLKTYHTMLVETTEHIRKQMKEGKTLDQIKAAGVQEKYKSWAWNFIGEARWIEIVHRSLMGEGQLRSHMDVPPGKDGHGHPHPPK